MPTIILNKFDGGIAEDVRTQNIGENEKSLNFDIFTNPTKLIPLPDNVADVITASPPPTMDDAEMADVGIGQNAGTTYLMSCSRTSSASAVISFYQKSSLSAVWGAQTNGTGVYIKGTSITYKGNFYAVTSFGGNTLRLEKFNGASSTIGTSTTAVDISKKVAVFIHPKDNILYILNNNVIISYDGSTFTEYTTILPTGTLVADVTDYGDYLAIAVNPIVSVGQATVYLWGRDGTINTLQDSINFGNYVIKILENIDGVLVAIMDKNFSFSTVNDYRIVVKAWAGGSVEIIKILTATSIAGIIHRLKAKRDNKLFFGISNDSNVYCLGKNKSGRFVVVKDRYFTNAEASSQTLANIVNIGDVMWVGAFDSAGTYTFMRTKTPEVSGGITYTNISLFKTTINPSMPIADRYKNKQLKSVAILYTGASSGLTALKYSVDGSALTTIISDTNATGEKVTEAVRENDGKPFGAGREFQFQVESSGGSQIKQIIYEYEILNTTT